MFVERDEPRNGLGRSATGVAVAGSPRWEGGGSSGRLQPAARPHGGAKAVMGATASDDDIRPGAREAKRTAYQPSQELRWRARPAVLEAGVAILLTDALSAVAHYLSTRLDTPTSRHDRRG